MFSLLVRELLAEDNVLEKKVQKTRPQRTNKGYGRLPDGILKSRVRYSPNGANGNSKLTLHLRPEKVEQTRKIADLLAEYVMIQTGARQEVVPIGDGFYTHGQK